MFNYSPFDRCSVYNKHEAKLYTVLKKWNKTENNSINLQAQNTAAL